MQIMAMLRSELNNSDMYRLADYGDAERVFGSW
jgi:hypothetical protein